MKIVNKKLMAIVIILLVVIEVSTLFLMYKSLSSKPSNVDEVKLKEEKNGMFAIMLEQEDGTYLEVDTWPNDGYVYDSVQSGCMDENGNKIDGALSFDESTNIASVETGKTTYCYLFFSIENTSLAPGLYAEDGTLMYTWEQLTNLEQMSFTYNYYNEMMFMDEEMTTSILMVDETGILTSCYQYDSYDAVDKQYLTGKLVLDTSVTAIGDSCFKGLINNLTGIIIPSSVTTIGNDIFGTIGVDGHGTIPAIAIPDSVVDVNPDAFTDASNIGYNGIIYYSGTDEALLSYANRLEYSAAPAELKY